MNNILLEENLELKKIIETINNINIPIKQINLDLSNKLSSVKESLEKVSSSINNNYTLQMIQNLSKSYAEHFKMLQASLNDTAINRLASINDIMMKSISALNSFIGFEDSIGQKSNLYKVLSQSTSYIVRYSKPNPEELVEESLPAKINYNAILMIDLFEKLQKLDLDLVKLTPKICNNIANIVGVIATNDNEFSIICNSLYQVFYESFGASNHRSSKYVSFDDHKALLTIKHLRLNYFHDYFNGDYKAVKKKNDDIMSAFNRIINKKLPENSKDYKYCQLNLYLLIIDWLELIIRKINNSIID